MTLSPGESWTPPGDWIRITTLDVHTAGEPLRILTGGFPELPGDTILEKRRYAKAHQDHLRTALMWEPRGHADMYGAIVTEPVTEDGDLGVLFIHNEGFSTMCGHGIIGLAMAGVEGGAVPLPPGGAPIRMDTPAGRVTAYPETDADGTVTRVSFLNVPSYVAAVDEPVDVEGVGPVRFDLAFGGAYYAYCRASDFGLSLDAAEFRTLIDLGMRIKRAVMDTVPIVHPFEPDLGFLYGTIFVGDAHDPGNHSRNVCIFAEGEVDRCPTGTGVSARAALHHARGELEVGERFTVESILGTTFSGEVAETTEFGGHAAVIPRVTGTSFVTGRNELLLDPRDPLRHGFILR
jgi:trans-L-3-hydroxyproline dehydratase